MNIPIYSAGTAYTLGIREKVILVFVHGLSFGNRMDRSLINTNKCRDSGISVCDKPKDGYQYLIIDTY